MPGTFINSIYLADDTLNYAIRIQPETIIGTNGINPAPGTGTLVTGVGRVYAHTGNRRKRGIHARYASFKWVDPTAPPAGYFGYGIIRIPILLPTAYASLKPGVTTATYFSVQMICVGKTPESDKR